MPVSTSATSLDSKHSHADECVSHKTTKKRQRTRHSREEVIHYYKNDVSSVWIGKPSYHNPWFQPSGLWLDCKSIDSSNLPIGFTCVGNERYQYNFTDPNAPTAKRHRPAAYRVPFIEDPSYYDPSMTVSHLCHNNWCYNFDHHVLESLEVNKSRNGCPGGPSCRHKTKCIIPGKYSES